MKAANESLQINDNIRNCIPAHTDILKKRLEESILSDKSIHEPILIWGDTIVDGYLRYEIARSNKIPFTTLSVDYNDEEDAIKSRVEIHLNRRNLSPFERATLAIKYFKPIIESESEKRMLAGKSDPELISTQGKTRVKLAKIADVGSDSIYKVEHIITNGDEELLQKLEENKITINKAFSLCKWREQLKDIEKQKEAIKDLKPVDGKYDVIVIDPPWKMAKLTYPYMTNEEIRQFVIPAKEDAVIFLWVVHTYLPFALELLKNWGFEYKHTFVWNKMKHGRGHYALEQVEFCLVGIKGKPSYHNYKYSDLISESKREPGRKPQAIYELVREICHGTRIDIFARERHEGFDAWGNDVDKFKEEKLNDDNAAPDVEF